MTIDEISRALVEHMQTVVTGNHVYGCGPSAKIIHSWGNAVSRDIQSDFNTLATMRFCEDKLIIYDF